VAAAVGLLLVLLVAALAVRAYALYANAQEARSVAAAAVRSLSGVRWDLSREQARTIAAELARVDGSLAPLDAALEGDPAIVAVRPIPVVGSQIDHAAKLVHAARLLTSRHETLGSLLDQYVTARDTGRGLERIAALARFGAASRPQSAELAAAFREADKIVSGVPTEGLLPELGALRSSIDQELARLRPLVSAADAASSVLPSVMGVGGQKRYLVLAMDNAEVRPAGGLNAAFATPSLRDGLLADQRFRDILDVDTANTPYVAPPEPLRDYLLGTRFQWQVADAGWSPDFAVSAREARRLYAIETGDKNFQGTIAFGPELVDELLKVVGPVAVPGAGITVHPGETYILSLEQAEVLNRGPGRKQFLADLASRVLDRLLALSPDRYADVFGALDRAGKRRQVQVFLDDPTAQAAVNQLNWYTPFAFPAQDDHLAIVEANVSPVSKLHVLLKLQHSLDVTLRPDGGADERLVMTYTNTFGPKLPPLLERVRSTFRFGILGTYQRRYLRGDAEVTDVHSDGEFPLGAPGRIEGELGSLSVANYLSVPPGVLHLETKYSVRGVVVSAARDPARSGTYTLHFRKQAGRDKDTLTVRVTVPPGTHPQSPSQDGQADGQTVTFKTTTEFDRTFVVTYAAG
jgi:uncharacterized protein DUF4012